MKTKSAITALLAVAMLLVIALPGSAGLKEPVNVYNGPADGEYCI